MNLDSEDIELSPDEDMGDLSGAHAKIKKLRDELKETQKKAAEHLDGWQRCKAESINARKDALRDAERAAEREKDSFVQDLLPVLDSFDMAASTDAFTAMSEDWQQGIRHIHNQLVGVLESHGVVRFGNTGDAFDPRIHEALQETADMPGEPHTIVRIIRYGYRAGERIIRPVQAIIHS
jgi:molecular chaperone GrpE